MKPLLSFLALLVLLAVFSAPVDAQSPVRLAKDTAILEFPDQVTFRLELESDSPLEKVNLLYGTNGRSCAGGVARRGMDLQASSRQELEWAWEFRKSGTLPPGAQIWWQWEVSLSSGEKILTERQSLTVEDPLLDWQTIEREGVRVMWAEGDASFGSFLVDTAVNSLERLSRSTGVRPEGQILLVVYPSAQDLLQATLHLPEWTGGVAFGEYGVVLVGIAPEEKSWAEQVIPHELAHLVMDERVWNCLGMRLPTWLSEGLAVYSEGTASAEDIAALQNALQAGKMPTLRSQASGFAADPQQAGLAYAQSGQVVTFLIQTYGAEQLSALLSTIQSGKNVDEALQAVYGWDTDGLDAAWRASWGFETSLALATSTQAVANTPIPTLALWTAVPRLPTATSTALPEPAETQPPTAIPAPTLPPPTSTPVIAAAPPETGFPGWLWGLGGLALLGGMAFLVRARQSSRL